MSILTSGPETWPWGPVGWVDPCMTGCLEGPLASPVLAQSWSQTATDGAWSSTTALLSGRDRPRCLCVLRLSGSEPKTRRTGSVATSLPSNSLLVARAGNVELDRYPQLMLPGAEIRQYARPRLNTQRPLTSFMGRGLSVDHQPSRR